MTLDPSFWW
uniref:Uncharacterized protein n=1 Tax=Arundo donax TaxID=35708 RepID=A0A0A8ZS40_ARUDO